ncbi:hypothetical protein HHI36_005187, partial [Cryptolaemus montrouzieri]
MQLLPPLLTIRTKNYRYWFEESTTQLNHNQKPKYMGCHTKRKMIDPLFLEESE